MSVNLACYLKSRTAFVESNRSGFTGAIIAQFCTGNESQLHERGDVIYITIRRLRILTMEDTVTIIASFDCFKEGNAC